MAASKYRTKPTVDAGIVKRHWAGAGSIRAVQYEPGNGTSYQIFAADMSYEQCQLFGYDPGCVMVTIKLWYLPTEYVSHPMYTDGRTIFSSEVKEWFAFQSENDAEVVAELLAFLLGCEFAPFHSEE